MNEENIEEESLLIGHVYYIGINNLFGQDAIDAAIAVVRQDDQNDIIDGPSIYAVVVEDGITKSIVYLQTAVG